MGQVYCTCTFSTANYWRYTKHTCHSCKIPSANQAVPFVLQSCIKFVGFCGMLFGDPICAFGRNHRKTRVSECKYRRCKGCNGSTHCTWTHRNKSPPTLTLPLVHQGGQISNLFEIREAAAAIVKQSKSQTGIKGERLQRDGRRAPWPEVEETLKTEAAGSQAVALRRAWHVGANGLVFTCMFFLSKRSYPNACVRILACNTQSKSVWPPYIYANLVAHC